MHNIRRVDVAMYYMILHKADKCSLVLSVVMQHANMNGAASDRCFQHKNGIVVGALVSIQHSITNIL